MQMNKFYKLGTIVHRCLTSVKSLYSSKVGLLKRIILVSIVIAYYKRSSQHTYSTMGRYLLRVMNTKNSI